MLSSEFLCAHTAESQSVLRMHCGPVSAFAANPSPFGLCDFRGVVRRNSTVALTASRYPTASIHISRAAEVACRVGSLQLARSAFIYRAEDAPLAHRAWQSHGCGDMHHPPLQRQRLVPFRMCTRGRAAAKPRRSCRAATASRARDGARAERLDYEAELRQFVRARHQLLHRGIVQPTISGISNICRCTPSRASAASAL